MPNNPQPDTFATALDRGDHHAALDILVDLASSGRRDQAAALLQVLAEMATAGRRTTVVQRINTVPAGATVVGYQAGSL